MKFDENLRAMRKEKDISQEYLAEKMNVSRQTISKWENGTAMPDLKKLGELVELFDTTMDELLGTSIDVPRHDDNIDIAGYVDAVVSAKMEQYNKKNSTKQIISNIAIIVLAIGLVVTSFSISNLRSSINNVSYTPPQVIYNDDDSESIVNFVDCYIDSIDDKTYPNNANVVFSYKPVTYVKGTTVSFIVSDYTSSQAQPQILVAEQNGKSFSAITSINFASFNGVDISVDDGTNVTTETLEIDWLRLYRDFDFDAWGITVDGKKTTVDFAFPDNTIKWDNLSYLPDITEAYVTATRNGEQLYKKELKINRDGVNSYVELPNFTVDEANAEICVTLVDEYSTRYLFKSVDDLGLPEQSIEFNHGGRLSVVKEE